MSTSTRTTPGPNTRLRRAWRGPLTIPAWYMAFGMFCVTCTFNECIRAVRLMYDRMRALELGIGMFVSRVPTHENLSDNPSREEYQVLRDMGAVEVNPHLSAHFRKAMSWEALSIRQRGLESCMAASAATCDLP